MKTTTTYTPPEVTSVLRIETQVGLCLSWVDYTQQNEDLEGETYIW